MLAVLIGFAVLGVVGLSVEDKLDPLSLTIGGTGSARGEALAKAHFGDATQFAVLLTGPEAEIEKQGPPLVRALRHMPTSTVISPWDRGTVTALRPGRNKALIIVDYHVPLATAMRDTVPALQQVVDENISPPLEATQSGFASVSRGLQEETIDATERAELLAAPLLLLVLLLVFRSLVAAAIPLLFGALTVFAGRGVLVLLSSVMTIDAISLVVCTMMGLALGVDYSLLIVSRFREELAAGRPPHRAAALTRRSAGRTTAIAGATLFLSIFLSAFVQPGTLLVSLATALAVVTAIAVLIAWIALPALLTILGTRINAGQVGRSRPGAGRSRVAAAAAAALRRPALAGAAIAIPLLLLATPALAFNTGSPGVDELSSHSQARDDAEAIAETAGPGWEAPFLLTVASERGPITGAPRLRFLAATQRRIERSPGVDTVIGPAAIAAAGGPIRSLGSELDPEESSTTSQLSRLAPQLHRASGAVSRLRGGLSEASVAAGLLGEGSARAEEGAGLLAGGLGRAGAGGERASGALARLASGTRKLAAGQREAAATAYSLSLGLHTLAPDLSAQGLARARHLAARLRSIGSGDPALRAATHEADVLASVLAGDREELQRLGGQATTLKQGLGRLYSGGKQLRGGSARLATEAQRLGGGIQELGAGAQRLAGGLGALQGGAETLEGGLAGGFHRSYPLQQGLHQAGDRVSRAAAPLSRRLARLHRLSPRIFDSGFLALAAIDGSPNLRRTLAAEVLDVARGGTAARYLIVPYAGFNSPGSRRLGSRLEPIVAGIDRHPGLTAGLGGGAAVLNDYGSATKARLPLVIGAIIAITFLMLLALLRAPLLAAIAVGLNLLSVAAAIGVVTLACEIPDGYPLGGHPYIDTVGAAAIFGVTFGLSIDYAVFLLARMRERHERDGDNRAAIHFGLEKTAGVITGAAAIMAAVFASFAAAPVATVSQMGLGLTVAVLLDATVVRIVLLPALMLLLGDRVWHTPSWLERVLPPFGRTAPVGATAQAGV
jgi:RND superfamily putative drug exporter